MFGQNLPLKDTSLSDFYKNRHGEGITGPYLHGKVHGCDFINVGLQVL